MRCDPRYFATFSSTESEIIVPVFDGATGNVVVALGKSCFGSKIPTAVKRYQLTLWRYGW